MNIQQQNPDGSWSEIQPMGWQGGLYWEVSSDCAELVGPDRTVTTIRSRWPWLLRLKMLVAAVWHSAEHRRVRRGGY